MEAQMSKTHQTTYNAVFQHPIVRNLQCLNVRSMLNALTDVTEEHNGSLKFTRNGETLMLHLPQHRDLSDSQTLMKIRHFLERSEVPIQAIITEGVHLLVVIDPREACIYKAELHGSVPERITPYDPDGSHRHLHNVDDDSNSQRKPELKAFYEAIAQTIN